MSTNGTKFSAFPPTTHPGSPWQVGQLMAYVNNMYFDGRLDLTDKSTVKHMMQGTSYTDDSYDESYPARKSTSVITSD